MNARMTARGDKTRTVHHEFRFRPSLIRTCPSRIYKKGRNGISIQFLFPVLNQDPILYFDRFQSNYYNLKLHTLTDRQAWNCLNNNLHASDRFVLQQQFFHVTMIYIFPTTDHHVLYTPNDTTIAIFIDRRQIASMYPPIGVDRFRGPLRIVPISHHHSETTAWSDWANLTPREDRLRVLTALVRRARDDDLLVARLIAERFMAERQTP